MERLDSNDFRLPAALEFLRHWVKGAQFTVTPEGAPASNAPLLVVTVEGLLGALDTMGKACTPQERQSLE